jgi:ABC-type multidrug transport system fused ATPase/permease subunit
MDFLSNLVFAFSLVVLVRLPEDVIRPSIAGLAVTYGLNLNAIQALVIWLLCFVETQMISVERIMQYSRIPGEPPVIIENCRPNSNWPSRGTIDLTGLQVRYGPHLPLVLKGLTCTFPGGMKVGIVGRTGSGKSTLIQSLFRIVEPTKGRIVVDGVDISTIGLHDLRSKLSIIPQEPTMFGGTIRNNLDPLEHYSDDEIWECLDKCQLGEIVRAKENKLDSSVAENGGNWSVGQCQLVCLGRALLKQSRILVLDEATASVDSATDGFIQQLIRHQFSACTVITIAHRVPSVIDSDLVLVLKDGQIAEYDTPSKLLGNRSSAFAKLVSEYSSR